MAEHVRGCYCEECRAEKAAYMREYRAARPDVRNRARRQTRARSRALTRLAHQYPDDYHRLWLEELAKDPG